MQKSPTSISSHRMRNLWSRSIVSKVCTGTWFPPDPKPTSRHQFLSSKVLRPLTKQALDHKVSRQAASEGNRQEAPGCETVLGRDRDMTTLISIWLKNDGSTHFHFGRRDKVKHDDGYLTPSTLLQ